MLRFYGLLLNEVCEQSSLKLSLVKSLFLHVPKQRLGFDLLHDEIFMSIPEVIPAVHRWPILAIANSRENKSRVA